MAKIRTQYDVPDEPDERSLVVVLESGVKPKKDWRYFRSLLFTVGTAGAGLADGQASSRVPGASEKAEVVERHRVAVVELPTGLVVKQSGWMSELAAAQRMEASLNRLIADKPYARAIDALKTFRPE